MTNPLLSVRDVGWRVGRTTVLERVSFDVAPGELVAVMGRNGAGKSTLIDIVAGLRSPATGSVRLADRPLDRWSAVERARVVAHLPQHLRTDPTLVAESLVLMGRYAHAAHWFECEADLAIAREAMERCNCLQFRTRQVGTLSGGERQRLFLAACLAQRPGVLLLDEPATFLDVDQQTHCFEVLRSEAARGAACMAVTHDINLALTFCSRLIVLAERTLVRDIPAETALDAPEWLTLLSGRLTVDTNAAQRRWVRYQ
jgi:iron complex transport system ATP-binding protein